MGYTYFDARLLGSNNVGVDLTQRIPPVRGMFRLLRIASTQCQRLRVLILIQNPNIHLSGGSSTRRCSRPGPNYCHPLTRISLHLNLLHSSNNLCTTSIVTLIRGGDRYHLPWPITTTTTTTRSNRIRVW
ncbi:hypothetical protein Hanom_Chr07g00640421 [Helianthus anomalus]